jgi:hypothetical protein
MREESRPLTSQPARPASPWYFIVLVVVAVILIGGVLFFFDPSRHGFYPPCQFHKLTGWNCPGCGATRATYQLLHGHFRQALRDNALFVATAGAAAVWGIWQLARKARGRPAGFAVKGWALWGYLIATLLFGVLRNLPGFEWLSP